MIKSKLVYNVGYLGEGTYKSWENGKHTIQYKYWLDMLRRCYSKIYLKDKPTYEDKYVCEEWLNFQTFARWFDENYYECNGEVMCLDKDILVKGNKVYSPATCVFVPKRINQLFLKKQNNRGECPLGVSKEKRTGKFQARCSIYKEGKSKNIQIGTYITKEQAFYDGYKPFKQDYIKEVANDYKEDIPTILYESMMNYIIEISD